jgi:nucleotide-binding universal stress UspA family protein
MSVREILVCIDDAESVAQRMAPAATLAAATGARLTGVFASGASIDGAYGDLVGWMRLMEAFREAQRGAAAAAEAAFRQELACHRLPGDWIFREGDPTDTAIALSPLYDLIVLGQPDPAAEPDGALGVRPAEVVLGAGRPVLVVPYVGNFAAIGKRVLVAWNASREAARAVYDTMFALENADSVTLIEITPAPEPEPAAAGSARVGASDLAAALIRRGVRATAQTEAGGDIAVAELLLSHAADLAADLLVMGAWGHSRLREYVLGGVSRGILQHMMLPVLMSH